MRRFQVLLEKEQFTFSAAHFITLEGEICESLHGHNYGVRCEVEGPLGEERYVIDFLALRDELLKIVRDLDHVVLIPTRHSRIRVAQTAREVTVEYHDRRWVFPADNCRLLPVVNTTAEELAQFVGEQLIAAWTARGINLGKIDRLRVAIDENNGQWGTCVLIDRVGRAADPND